MQVLSFALISVLSFQGNFVASFPLETEVLNYDSRISSAWSEHAKDFLEMIDVDKVIEVVFGYLKDPEVLNFVTFLFSDEFKTIVWEFESMAEFKEAFKFLADKGYDVDSAIDYINDALNLPPFEKLELALPTQDDVVLRGTGMTGLIEDLIATIPIKEMKELFENKLETSPEVAELFETINSPEFMRIMKNMSNNQKFIEIKETFAGYGLDLKYLCALAKDIFGEYYQGVFCEN